MVESSFSELVSLLLDSMGQRLEATRAIPEGIVLRTGDGFLYAFLEDPDRVSLETIRQLERDAGAPSGRLVVLTKGRLPLALSTELSDRGATLVEAQRFHELVRQLGYESYLGEEPRPPSGPRARLLPSAQQLDLILGRARTWLDWGVPALALRFYRQAAGLKPEFMPARVGVARSLLALGLLADADRSFDEILSVHHDDLDARIGKAAVLGATGRTREEIDVYRRLLKEDPGRIEVRAHLVAALVAGKDWSDARGELEAMLETTPEDAQLRFLYGVTLEKTGKPEKGQRERDAARRLGLSLEREASLSAHLGTPGPAPPHVPPVGQAAKRSVATKRARNNRRTTRSVTRKKATSRMASRPSQRANRSRKAK